MYRRADHRRNSSRSRVHADPNRKVSGLGFEKLRAAGIHVEVGRLEEQARRLNEAFARYIRHGTPLVTLKAAMTLDGKIAPPPADRAHDPSAGGFSGNWITSEVARAHVQELRHQNDALLVGVGTVLSDNPLLTDRSGRPRRRPLLRVILDSRLRLPLESRLVQGIAAERNHDGRNNDIRNNDVLVFCTSANEQKKAQLENSESAWKRFLRLRSADVLSCPPSYAGSGALEITSVMIEGGAMVNWAALAANVVDKVFLYYAPRFWVGPVRFLSLPGAGFQPHEPGCAGQARALASFRRRLRRRGLPARSLRRMHSSPQRH